MSNQYFHDLETFGKEVMLFMRGIRKNIKMNSQPSLLMTFRLWGGQTRSVYLSERSFILCSRAFLAALWAADFLL